jgi:hypothetical protein
MPHAGCDQILLAANAAGHLAQRGHGPLNKCRAHVRAGWLDQARIANAATQVAKRDTITATSDRSLARERYPERSNPVINWIVAMSLFALVFVPLWFLAPGSRPRGTTEV